VKIVTSMERLDAGEMPLDDVPCAFETPIDARRAGVTAVYQDPMLLPHLNVAENIIMGIYPGTRPGLVDRKVIREGRMFRNSGWIPVEILRAMCADLRLLLLDEPTASLNPAEAERFFSIMDSLTERGISVVLISHHLSGSRGFRTTSRSPRTGGMSSGRLPAI